MMYFFKFFGMFDQYLLLSFILEVTEVKITFVALLILLYNMQITKCHGCLLQVLVMLDAVIFFALCIPCCIKSIYYGKA